MSWFLCVLSQKPFVEWEIEKFMKTHPLTKNTIIKNSFYFAYDAREEILYSKKPTEDDLSYSVVIGKGYLPKTTGYSQADANDWAKLLDFNFLPRDIDGHYLALKIKEDFLQVTSDVYAHYPVYFIKNKDYTLVSNALHFITPLLTKKSWNFASVGSLALMQNPLENTAHLNNVHVLEGGATLTVRKNKVTLTKRETNFLTDTNIDHQQYFFSLKKAFEFQLSDGDFFVVPFDADYSARFTFSVWCHKAKKTWGMYYLKSSPIKPEDFIDPFILSNLKVATIPEFKASKEIFAFYRNYVLKTGLSNFPDIFNLAGRFKPEKGINEITLLSKPAEWLFEKDPLAKTEKLFKIIKNKSFSSFKKFCIADNYFFRKDFYQYLVKDLEKYFTLYVNNTINADPIYDKYDFYLKAFHNNIHSKNLVWLNDYRDFYSPGLLYSLAINHVQKRLADPRIAKQSSELHLTIATESKGYPKIKEKSYDFPFLPNLNKIFFPIIANQIGVMIEKSAKIPYYNFPNLIKLFKKAKTGNVTAIDNIMKWTAFEIWRGYLD